MTRGISDSWELYSYFVQCMMKSQRIVSVVEADIVEASVIVKETAEAGLPHV